MDTSGGMSAAVEELPNPPDVGPNSHHQSPPTVEIHVNRSNEWLTSGSDQAPVLDANPVPPPDPVFVPIAGDQMDWRPTEDTTSPQNDSQPHIQSEDSTPPPIRQDQDPHAEPIHAHEEHAYWAEFDDDLSTPSEAELKEIVSAEDSYYSACQHDHWEQSFYPDLDDPDYRPSEKARFTWKLKGVRGSRERPNRDKIIRSPSAFVGGYWWTIKFFPRGNDVSSLSVYIECSETCPASDRALCQGEFKVLRGHPNATLNDSVPDVDLKLPDTANGAAWLNDYYEKQCPAITECKRPGPWRVSAQIGVVLYNPEEPRTGYSQSSCHQFNPHNPDWGWTNFHGPWESIHQRQRGQYRALLQNDTLAFDAYIRLFEDSTQSLWWHPSESEPTWDSLGLTGYRPLGDSVVNHSAEVAGLASWIHLEPFCKIIQGVDVLEHLSNCDVKPRPLCDVLQKFLWQLRDRDPSLEYVDTSAITSTLNNLYEHSSDVSEFWERLRRTLELELEGTEGAKQLAKLFDSSPVEPGNGPSTVTVNSLPADFNSRICIPAAQVRSVREGLVKYLSSKPGRWSLPPVLHIELARQKVDMLSRQWQLVYDRVDLDELLDLAPWTLEGVCGNYVLYGYVAHSGQRNSGKFFSILRPGGPGTMWLAFDDSNDNRVEWLTGKTAFGPHLGAKNPQKVDHKTGHNVAVITMYIRSDCVEQFLPGPQGRWDAPEHLQRYYENGTYFVLKAPDGSTSQQHLNVEVYSLPSYDQLGSLFDTYDLMSRAKSTNNVLYLRLPRSTSMVEVRNRIAQWKSVDGEQACAEHVRLWQIGHTRERFGPTLAFARISNLNETLEQPLNTVRFWMQIVSDGDAKYFAMADPQDRRMSENKPREAVVEHEDSASSGSQSTSGDGETREVSSEPQANTGSESPDPVERTPSDVARNSATERTMTTGSFPSHAAFPPQPAEFADVVITDASDNNDPMANSMIADDDAAIAAMIANDVEEMDAEDQRAWEYAAEGRRRESEPTVVEPVVSQESNVSQGSSIPRRPKTRLPVRHVYYFIQIFDIENQALRTVGSFFSRLEEDIKSAVQKHLNWPDNKEFLIWTLVDGITVSSVAPGNTFEEHCLPDGACLIVRDTLSRERQVELEVSGNLTDPDLLVEYLWAKSRNHPIYSFTGTRTVEATFAGDYYSGEFNKGHYHGKGKHISDSASTYEGDFVFGQRHGKGVMVYPSGDTYDGDWVNDQRHGQGTFIEHKTGNKYVGGYKDGKRHGKGVSYWEVADEEMDLCQICYCEEQDALFYDCGHVCACVACARQVDVCPICRKNVIGVVRIYRT